MPVMQPGLVPDTPNAYTGGGVPKGIVMVVVLALLYILPSLLAWQRGRHGRRRIILLNLLLGWTVIGWAASMILLFRYEPPPEGEPDVPHLPGQGDGVRP